MIFKATIKWYPFLNEGSQNAIIYFSFEDILKPNLKFSIRELLIPWLLQGNIPEKLEERTMI